MWWYTSVFPCFFSIIYSLVLFQKKASPCCREISQSSFFLNPSLVHPYRVPMVHRTNSTAEKHHCTVIYLSIITTKPFFLNSIQGPRQFLAHSKYWKKDLSEWIKSFQAQQWVKHNIKITGTPTANMAEIGEAIVQGLFPKGGLVRVSGDTHCDSGL